MDHFAASGEVKQVVFSQENEDDGKDSKEEQTEQNEDNSKLQLCPFLSQDVKKLNLVKIN